MSTSISSLDAHAGYWLRFVSNHVSHAFKLKVEAHGVTIAEWVVLRELLRLESLAPRRIHPSEVASNLGLTRGAISKLVDRLINKKLARRKTASGDQRYQSLSLTTAGQALVPILARLADENDVAFFGHLSVKHRAALIELLQEIVRRSGLKNVPID